MSRQIEISLISSSNARTARLRRRRAVHESQHNEYSLHKILRLLTDADFITYWENKVSQQELSEIQSFLRGFDPEESTSYLNVIQYIDSILKSYDDETPVGLDYSESNTVKVPTLNKRRNRHED